MPWHARTNARDIALDTCLRVFHCGAADYTQVHHREHIGGEDRG